MEFPDLGSHCANSACNRLDFLPLKCDACGKLFCSDHLAYDSHDCPEKYRKNAQVPVCPLCQRPIPVTKRGDPPDLAVSRHIDSECQSDPAKERRKVFDQRCAVRKCKKKEMIKIRCDDCGRNHCLSHRHPQDHDCKGKPSAGQAAAAAALRRLDNQGPSKAKARATQQQQPPPPRRTTAADVQGQLSEDEAMARALQASMASAAQAEGPALTQEEIDRMTALALQESLNNAGRQRTAAAGGGSSDSSGNKSSGSTAGPRIQNYSLKSYPAFPRHPAEPVAPKGAATKTPVTAVAKTKTQATTVASAARTTVKFETIASPSAKTTSPAPAEAAATHQFDPYQAQIHSLTSYPRMDNVGARVPVPRISAPNTRIVDRNGAPPPYDTVVSVSRRPHPPPIRTTQTRTTRIIVSPWVPQPQTRRQPHQPMPQQSSSLNQIGGDFLRVGENMVRGLPPNPNDPSDTTEARIGLGCCCVGAVCCCATGAGVICCTIL